MNSTSNEIKNAYFKEWRKKNKNKVKEYNKRYWDKKADKLKENAKFNDIEKSR